MLSSNGLSSARRIPALHSSLGRCSLWDRTPSRERFRIDYLARKRTEDILPVRKIKRNLLSYSRLTDCRKTHLVAIRFSSRRLYGRPALVKSHMRSELERATVEERGLLYDPKTKNSDNSYVHIVDWTLPLNS